MSPPPLAFRALGCPYGANVPILYPPPPPPFNIFHQGLQTKNG